MLRHGLLKIVGGSTGVSGSLDEKTGQKCLMGIVIESSLEKVCHVWDADMVYVVWLHLEVG